MEIILFFFFYQTLSTITYKLEVTAKDLAGNQVAGTETSTASFSIPEKNEHAPEFTSREFEARVHEGMTCVIAYLTVGDRDDPGTGAWRAVYSIVSGDPTHSFQIQTNQDNEGVLSVTKPLDYETATFHTLIIKVENEEPLLPEVGDGTNSTATVNVTVEDINESPVFFPDPMIVNRMENVPLGSFVASLNTTDPDILDNQSIRYSVLRDPAGWLSVDPNSGHVSTSSPLDRESPFVHDNKYTAVIIAEDNGTPPATGTGTLIIQLEDYNDNAPYMMPSVARVCEDDVNGVVVGGWDKDIPPNTAPFKIELGKQPGLDETWKVTRVNDTHSRIVLLHSLKKGNYRLPLIITDSGFPPLSKSTELKVEVSACKNKEKSWTRAPLNWISLFIPLAILLLICVQSFTNDRDDSPEYFPEEFENEGASLALDTKATV